MAILDIIIRAQNQASAVLNSLERDLQSLNQQAQDAGTALSLGVTAPFTLFAKTGIQTVSEFSRTMAELEVVTGASGDTLQTLNDTAIELGAVTSFSANEAATAMLELSKAGMSTEEVLSSIPGVLALAAAGGVELGYAANLTASSLNAFQMDASESGYVANLLAAAANESSASIGDLAMGLQQGGFAFNAAGQDIDDLAASLAILTNVGLTGSDAGTALKNAFTRMMSPTEEAKKLMDSMGLSFYNTNGEMKPMEFIIGDLNESLSGMTQEQRNAALETLFLSDGMKAMIPLLTLGQDGFLEMKDAVNEVGAAQAVADAKMSGLAGAFEYASGSIESALLKVWGPLEDTFVDIVKAGADFITWLSELPAPVLNAALAFVAVLAAAGPLLLAIPAITAFLSAMLTPIGLLVLAVAGLAAAWASNFGDIQGKTKEVADAIKEAISTGNFQPVFNVLSNITSEIVASVSTWATKFTTWASEIWADTSFYLDVYKNKLSSWITFQGALLGLKMKRWAKEFWTWATEIWADLDINLATMWTSLTTWIDSKVDLLYPYLYKWATEFWTWTGEVWAELSPELETLGASIITWAQTQGAKLGDETAKWGEKTVDWVPSEAEITAAVQPIETSMVTGFLGFQESISTAIGYMIGAALGGAVRFLTDAISLFVIGIIGSINMQLESEESQSTAGEGLGTLMSGMFKNAGRMIGAMVKGFVDQIKEALTGRVAQLMDEEWARLTTNLSAKWDEMTSSVSERTANMSTAWDNLASSIGGAVLEMRTSVSMGFLMMKTSVESEVSAIKSTVLIDFALMKLRMEGTISDAVGAVIGKFNEIKTGVSTAIEDARATIETKFNEIKMFLSGLDIPNPFEVLSSALNGLIDLANRAKAALGGIGGGGGTSGANAAGTSYFRGGMTTINERGTELIALPGRNRQAWLPRGTAIYPAEQSPMLMGAGGGVTVNVYATVNNGMDAESLAHTIAGIMRRNQR